MKLTLTFFMAAFAYQVMATPVVVEDPDVMVGETEEENYVDDDRANTMDWGAVPDKIEDMQRVKQWFDDLMASAENEILMKAKLVVAVESPLEDLVQQIGVSPGDAQLIQNFAFAQLMKIRDYEQQQLQQQMMEMERAQMEQQRRGGYGNPHEGLYDFESEGFQGADSPAAEWDVENPETLASMQSDYF